MKRKILATMTFFIVILLVQSVLGEKIDSDGDGVLDEYDKCPGTSPDAVLPIILRNPEFLGCSCPQIYELMREEYCEDIYCHPGRPLEIKDRTFSSRSNPCPPPRCEDTTLYEYFTDKILCYNGKEQSYECEEVITENADKCINQLIDAPVEPEDELRELDIFDVLVSDYSDEDSKFVNLLRMKTKDEIIKNNDDVLRRISVVRIVELEERIINNRSLMVADVSIIVTPNKYYAVEDFVLIENLIGDIHNKNIVFEDESFFDEEKQIVVWEINHLKDEVAFNYRVTPGDGLDFEVVVQGNTKSTAFYKLIIPLLILIFLITLVVAWIVNMKEKNKVFKS